MDCITQLIGKYCKYIYISPHKVCINQLSDQKWVDDLRLLFLVPETSTEGTLKGKSCWGTVLQQLSGLSILLPERRCQLCYCYHSFFQRTWLQPGLLSCKISGPYSHMQVLTEHPTAALIMSGECVKAICHEQGTHGP